jgi:hypothetical protein
MSMRIDTNQYGLAGSYSGKGWDYLYKGDYDVTSNAGGWPGPTKRDGIAAGNSRTNTPALKLKEVRQYAVVTFDARFDGSKVALVGCFKDSARPDYTTYRIVDYVELTDSAGAPIKISQACVEDPGSTPKKILSWQCRHGLDNRSNADGYVCWDLLPMTLQNTDQTGGLDANTGYEPWRVVGQEADTGWWGNASDGFFANQANRITAQADAPGYMDIRGRICNNRNTNDYTRYYPSKRGNYNGLTTLETTEAMAERQSFSRHDKCLNSSGRQPSVKECTISVPTGIGRQCQLVESSSVGASPHDPATWPGPYSGRQHTMLPALTWTEGNNTNDDRYKWSAFSWNSWHDIYSVTDLCQQILYSLGSTAEDRDIYDGDQDGRRDEQTTKSLAYDWNGGSVTSLDGRFIGELKQLNKLNLNDMYYPPAFSGVGYNNQWYGNRSSYTSFGRKPLKGFHSPSDSMTYHFWDKASYHHRIKPWSLSDDSSEDFYSYEPDKHGSRYDSSHCTTSPVYTVFVTGNAVDELGEPLAEMRARVTMERTWDGRMNILEFTWMPTDRGFME